MVEDCNPSRTSVRSPSNCSSGCKRAWGVQGAVVGQPQSENVAQPVDRVGARREDSFGLPATVRGITSAAATLDRGADDFVVRNARDLELALDLPSDLVRRDEDVLAPSSRSLRRAASRHSPIPPSGTSPAAFHRRGTGRTRDSPLPRLRSGRSGSQSHRAATGARPGMDSLAPRGREGSQIRSAQACSRTGAAAFAAISGDAACVREPAAVRPQTPTRPQPATDAPNNVPPYEGRVSHALDAPATGVSNS